MQINALLASYGAVPSVPKVMALLLTELNQPAPDLLRIKRFVAADPGLTCRVLQVANADAADHAGTVTGVNEAVDLLGVSRLQALGQAAATAAASVVVPGVGMQQFWRVSLNAAKVARALARQIGSDPTAAFTCGMLHGIGEMIMHLGMPQATAALDHTVAPFQFGRDRAEEQAFGYSYALVSAELASKWRFPQVIVTALRYHLDPFGRDVYEPLTGVVHLAAWRARAVEANFTPQQYAVEFPYTVGLALGLDIDMVLQQEPVEWRTGYEDTN